MMDFDIAALSLANHGKAHCGDHYKHTYVNEGNSLVACVADGVGSFALDWKASMLAVDVFLEAMRRTPEPGCTDSMLYALQEANRAVINACAGGPRMASTFVAITWDCAANRITWSSIGDSRLYSVETRGELRLLSRDQAKAVLMRDSSGKLLASSGALTVRAGLTAAMGDFNFNPTITTVDGDATVALLLATDGMYNNPAFTDKMVSEILTGISLQKALDSRADLLRSGQSDDATIVIVRNNSLPEDIEKRIAEIIEHGSELPHNRFSTFHVSRTASHLLKSAQKQGDKERLMRLLEFVDRNGIKPGFEFFKTLLDIEASGRQDREVIQRLLKCARAAQV